MQFKLIDDISALKLIQNEWNLLFNLNKYSVFQSFTFNYYSWKEILANNSSNRLFVIRIIENQRAIGFAPLYIDSSNTLRFINDIHSDTCDLILSKNIDLNKMLQFIYFKCKVIKLRFINLLSSSKLIQSNDYYQMFFHRLSSTPGYSTLEVNKGIFPDNNSNFLSKQKSEIRRIVKKYPNCEYNILSKDNFNFPIKEILFLRNSMIMNGIRSSKFLNHEQIRLIEKLYNSKLIEISIVRDINPIAISIILKNNSEFLFWIDLYDDFKMINLFNYISFIKYTSKTKKILINFGRGVYNYKVANFAPDNYNLYSLSIFSSRLSYIMYIFRKFSFEILKKIYIQFK